MDSEISVGKTCRMCGEGFTATNEEDAMYAQCCPACERAKAEKEREQRKESLISRWREICPRNFQGTDSSLLPCQKAVETTLAWKFSDRGLILHGPTGTGKSRTAWMLLEQIHMRGKIIKTVNSLSGVLYASKYSESGRKVERWLESLIEADVLFMDDIFKNKLTDSFEGAIFSIVDQRTENGRPMIITSNDTGVTLASRMTEDRGGPLVRRLREFCDAISFEKTEP